MDKITSRAVIGIMKQMLGMKTTLPWIDGVSNLFTSDQAGEEYAWIGASPTMKEWKGQRKPQTLPEYGFEIKNRLFEAALEIQLQDLRRDKTGQLRTRIQEMVTKAQVHWATLLSELIVNGESGTCYDGHYFFDTTHQEGKSGVQSNKIQIPIADLPVDTTTKGTVASPTIAQMQLAIAYAIGEMAQIVDDQGDPMNETATDFLVMTPPQYRQQVLKAVANPLQVETTETGISKLKQDVSINTVTNIRLKPLANKFIVFIRDSSIKALIRQEETKFQIKAKAEGSDFEFDFNAHQYGIDASRNAGYGRWQKAMLVELV